MKVIKSSGRFSSQNVKRVMFQVKSLETNEQINEVFFSQDKTESVDEVKAELDKLVVSTVLLSLKQSISVSITSLSVSSKGTGEHIIETTNMSDQETFETNLKHLRHLFVLSCQTCK